MNSSSGCKMKETAKKKHRQATRSAPYELQTKMVPLLDEYTEVIAISPYSTEETVEIVSDTANVNPISVPSYIDVECGKVEIPPRKSTVNNPDNGISEINVVVYRDESKMFQFEDCVDSEIFPKTKCLQCKVQITSLAMLIHHFSNDHKPQFKCPHCYIKFKPLGVFLLHLKDEHDIEADMKMIHGFVISLVVSENNFKSMVIVPKAPRRQDIACLFCKHCFAKPSSLWQHLTKVHKYCNACCIALKNDSDFATHKEEHAAGHIKFYKCTLCNLELKTSNCVVKHAQKYHLNETIEYERVSKPETILSCSKINEFYCSYCGIANGNSVILRKHLAKHTLCKCIHCKNQFVALEGISPKASKLCDPCIILKESMQNPSQNSSSETWRQVPLIKKLINDIPCIFCSDFKGSSLDMYVHTSEVHNICRFCMQQFESENVFQMHDLLHKNGYIKQFQCLSCSKIIKNADDLKSHSCKNSDNRYKALKVSIPQFNATKVMDNNQCPFCLALVTSDFAFGMHLASKHDIKECSICKSRFVNKENHNACEVCRNGTEILLTQHTPIDIITIDTADVPNN